MFIYLGYRDIVFNGIKLFLDIQEYGTIQFTTAIKWSLHLPYKPLESTLSRVDL